MDTTEYVIRSCGSQGGSLVLDPSNFRDVAIFTTRKAARAYADSIVPEMPSKYLPLRVQVRA